MARSSDALSVSLFSTLAVNDLEEEVRQQDFLVSSPSQPLPVKD